MIKNKGFIKKIRTFSILLFFANDICAQQADVVLTIGHANQINCLDINPDGTLIASGGNDNLLKIWDISTTKELRTFTGNDSRLEFVKFDGSGKYISGLNYSDKVNTWNVSTGELVSSFDAQSTVGIIDFCNEGKNLVYYTNEGEFVIADHVNGKEIRRFPLPGVIRFKMHPDGKKLYLLDYKANLKGIDIETGNVVMEMKLFDEFQFPVTRIDIDRSGKYLAANFVDNNIHVYDLENKKEYYVFKGHKNRVTDMQFEKSGDRLVSADHEKQIYVWDIKSKKELFHREANVFGANWLSLHPSEPIYLYCEFNTMHYCSLEEGEELKKFVSKANSIVSMDYAQDGKYLATAATDVSIKLWDLTKNKIDKKLHGFFPVEFQPGGKKLVCMGTPSALFIYSPESGEKLGELNTEYELIQNLSFSKDGKYLAGAGFTGVIRIWNMESGKIEKRLTGHIGGVYSTVFSPDGKTLASAGMDLTVKIWDLKEGKEIKSLVGHEVIVSDVDFSPDGKLLASSGWDKKVFLWNTASWELERKIEGHVNIILGIDFSGDGKYIASCAGNNVVAPADNSIRVWETATGKMVCKFDNPTGQINDVIFQDKGDLVFSCSNDGFIKIWDLKKCGEVASLASIGAVDHIVVTPDYYYTASKDALSAISFRVGDQLYPFEQFDIKLNRPDVLAERVGLTPPNLINAYKYLYKKRLKKLNFTDEQLGTDFHLPITEIRTKDINLFTTDSVVKFMVHTEDSKYKLDRLMIYLNGVPVYGSNGIDLKKYEETAIDYEVKLRLMDGTNQVSVSCINEKGAESLIKSFGIVKESTGEAHDLYVVSVGVSDYEQKNYNLNYAAKDAKDLVDKLSSSKGIYKEIHQLILTNEVVTKNNLQQIKDFLKGATINDAVILFFAGHGVLDENFDYFYATHDMNFDKPAEKGISYAEIEALLDAVKAIRKLLLMDTCHSGELDKEEVTAQKAKIEVKEVKFRSVGDGVAVKDPFGVGNTQELMNVLFTDVRKASGANVISSSGGAEFSIESAEYENGLFTYSLIQCLSDWKGDANLDQKYTVSEWARYALDNVYRLSGGMQKPTSRAVNLFVDFRVW